MENFKTFTAGILGIIAGLAVAATIPAQIEAHRQCGNTTALEAPCEVTTEINPDIF